MWSLSFISKGSKISESGSNWSRHWDVLESCNACRNSKSFSMWLNGNIPSLCDPSIFGYPFFSILGCYSTVDFVIFLHHHRASEGFMERPSSRDCVVRIPGIWCDVRDTCPLMATHLVRFWEGVPLVRTLTSMADLFIGITYWVIAIKDQWISGISHSGIDAPSLPLRRTGSGLSIHVLDPLYLGKYKCRSCRVLVLMI